MHTLAVCRSGPPLTPASPPRLLQEAVKTYGMKVTDLEAEMLVKDLGGGSGQLGFEQFRAAVQRIGNQLSG